MLHCCRKVHAIAGCVATLLLAGCQTLGPEKYGPPVNVIPPQSNVPRELSKVTLPPYIIEPPDILTIDAVRILPKSPYHLRALDVLTIEATGTLEDAPIGGAYPIGPDGVITLGTPYGSVPVAGMTVEEASRAIDEQLRKLLRDPNVTVNIAQLAGQQQIAGEHLVSPDGTVTLGTYGSVYVTGMTLAEAKAQIEAHLSRFLEEPEVAVDVFAYNSKVYYVITQGAGLGDGVTRFSVTGNETVLDAISQINGLESVSSKRIWIARPVPGCNEYQVLPVDWCAITGLGGAATNYQVLPGDRVFVAEDQLVAFDNSLAKLIAPMERLFGVTILGTQTVSGLRFFHRGGQGGFGNQGAPTP